MQRAELKSTLPDSVGTRRIMTVLTDYTGTPSRVAGWSSAVAPLAARQLDVLVEREFRLGHSKSSEPK
jgi:hypothetical protein